MTCVGSGMARKNTVALRALNLSADNVKEQDWASHLEFAIDEVLLAMRK